ncbi:MAG TPA: DUF3459 domain-containing protein [Glaciibacter sp.]|nr:DUF3459 domain-containing protein [Glaciibacter sp.]
MQERDPDSTLRLYRDALALRRVLQTGEQLEWIPSEPDVVHFRRPNGWEVVMNFGPVSVALPEGEVLLFSGPLEAGRLGGESTVWLRRG